jgi:hypothetical protein
VSEYSKHFATWVQDLLKSVMEKSITLGQQLVTWSVVGNAGGMVIGFNAAIQGASCARLIHSSAYSFAVGLALAFTSAVISYAGYLWGMVYLTKANVAAQKLYITDVAAREMAAESNGSIEDLQGVAEAWSAVAKAGQELSNLKARFLWIAPTIAVIFMTGSLLAFGNGILKPLGGPTGTLASCSPK